MSNSEGVARTSTEELQFNNPDAPNYDWQKDREWFNQRLSNARIHNHELEQRIARLKGALEFIADLPPGSKGAYSKFCEAQAKARELLGAKVKK